MLASAKTLSTPPKFPGWPERPADVVTVICEGPSAHQARDALLGHARGPIVAINRAVSLSEFMPIDVWATTDDPRVLWEEYSPHLHPETKLFSTDNNLLEWQAMGVQMPRIYTWATTYMDDYKAEGESLGPLIPTLFPVLAWILAQDTKEVRLLGADMIGSGTPGIDYQPDADEGHQMRWEVERFMLASAMRLYRLKGARIRRWQRSKTPR